MCILTATSPSQSLIPASDPVQTQTQTQHFRLLNMLTSHRRTPEGHPEPKKTSQRHHGNVINALHLITCTIPSDKSRKANALTEHDSEHNKIIPQFWSSCQLVRTFFHFELKKYIQHLFKKRWNEKQKKCIALCKHVKKKHQLMLFVRYFSIPQCLIVYSWGNTQSCWINDHTCSI